VELIVETVVEEFVEIVLVDIVDEEDERSARLR
jgi:hypothetical protein